MGVAPPAIHYRAEDEGEARKKSIVSGSFREEIGRQLGRGRYLQNLRPIAARAATLRLSQCSNPLWCGRGITRGGVRNPDMGQRTFGSIQQSALTPGRYAVSKIAVRMRNKGVLNDDELRPADSSIPRCHVSEEAE